MRILIIDDHAIVRRGIKDVLLQDMGESVIFEADRGQSALEMIEQEDIEMVILDIHLPDKNGLDVLKELKLMRPKLPVIILSLSPEEHYAVRALKAGASSYLTKESAPEELVLAIRKVAQGGKYVSESLGEKLAEAFSSPTSEMTHDRLSDRELEVLQFIGKGKAVGEIAEHLCLSVKTISTYRARILEKLDLHSTSDIIRYAIDHHID